MTRDVTAAVVRDRAEAQLMVGLLHTHHIRAWVSTDDASGVEAALSAQGVRVMVLPEDGERAKRIVGDPPGPPPRLNGFQRWVVKILGGRDSAS